MGDRITLETADERDVWLNEFAAKTGENWQPAASSYAAWDAVRAYRERKVHTLLGDLEPVVAARIGDAMGELIDADREERESDDDAPLNTGGFGGTHLTLPPGWTLNTTPAGDWRVTSAGEPSRAIDGPDAEELARGAWKLWARESDIPRDYTVPREQLERLLGAILGDDQVAYCMDPVSTVSEVEAAIEAARTRPDVVALHALVGDMDTVATVGDIASEPGLLHEWLDRLQEAIAEQGPTERASDAGDWTEEQISEVARQLVHQWGGVLGTGYGDLHARFCVHILDGLLVDSGRGRPPTGEASPTRNAAGDIALQIAPVLTRQRDRAEAKLGTLIGAVETAVDFNLTTAGPYPRDLEQGLIEALRVALDAAKGDAPTVTTRFGWTEEERTRADWGEALGLDPNGAPYSVALLSSETERLTGSPPSVPRRLVVRARENLKSVGLIDAANAVDGILSDADHGLIRPCAGCSYDCNRCDRTRSPASPEPRATPAAYVASAVHNEKRAKAAEAKLGTLIGAVEDEAGLLRDWAGVIGDSDASAALTAIADRLDAAKGGTPAHSTQAERRGDGLADHWLKRARGYHDEMVRSDAKLDGLAEAVRDVTERPSLRLDEALERLRDALDAAKGDAPTVTPSPSTPEPQVDCKRCDDTGIVVTGPCAKLYPVPCPEGCPAPAPQVPDSPGWSNLHDRALTVALQVERFAEEDGSWASLNRATKKLREALKGGGRCTRGAPDDGLRARVERAIDEAEKLIAVGGAETWASHGNPTARAAWHRGRAARELVDILKAP